MTENPRFDVSYERLFGQSVSIGEEAGTFFADFYRNFLSRPEIRELFRDTDMARQGAMLRRSLFHLVAFYVSHEPSAELERIALVHSRLGIADRHYDQWLDALLETVRVHDAECDEITELAWRLALTPGITYMRLLCRLQAPPESASG
jgi:hemoglobin-like flavoprotein